MSPRSGRRAWRVLALVLGGLLGLVLVAVAGLVAFVQLGPVTERDRRAASSDLDTVRALSLFPLEAMVDSVGRPADAASVGALENRLTNTLGQVDVLIEEAEGLREDKLVRRDDTLADHADDLVDAYEDLRAALEEWADDGYGEVAYLLSACGRLAEGCTGDVDGGRTVAELVAVRTAVDDPDRATALADAADGLTAATDALWAEVMDPLDALEAALGGGADDPALGQRG